MAKELVKEKGVSIRVACWIFGISERCYRYVSKQSDENALLADWLMRLTESFRRWTMAAGVPAGRKMPVHV